MENGVLKSAYDAVKGEVKKIPTALELGLKDKPALGFGAAWGGVWTTILAGTPLGLPVALVGGLAAGLMFTGGVGRVMLETQEASADTGNNAPAPPSGTTPSP